MDFTEELLDFPSAIQKTVYCEARQLTPLITSITFVSPNDLAESCTEYYHFYQALLSDMYDNPRAYFLPVGEYEEFLQGRKITAMKQLEPKMACKVVSHVENSVMRYTLVLSLLGYYGKLENNTLQIPSEAWSFIKKSTFVPASQIPLEKRLHALERVGLIVKDDTVISQNYPLMFKGMKALAMKTKGKSSGFPYYLFQKADFRNISLDYKPTYRDYFNPLRDSQNDLANQIHDYATKVGCKVVISTFLKVDYKYKGSQVMCIDSAKNMLRIRIVETYAYNATSLIEDKVKRESKEFVKYFLQHIWRCRACSTTHLGVIIKILGKTTRVCGGGLIGLEWFNPTSDDWKFIKKFIDFRCSIIDELAQ